MANRSNDPSKTVATIGYISTVPAQRGVSGGGVESYQNKSQISYGDKQSGWYGRETSTEKASAGDFHWKNGTTGTRSEYTQRSTVRFGDKSGYTEVRNEQTFRNVTYDRSGCSSKNYGGYGTNNNVDRGSGYSSSGGGSYGGYGYNNSGGGSYGGNEYGSYDGGYDYYD